MQRREFARTLSLIVAGGGAIASSACTTSAAGAKSRGVAQAGASVGTHEDAMVALLHELAPDSASMAAVVPAETRHIGMLIYPGMFALDMVGPFSILSGLMNTKVHLVAKTMDPVDATGIPIVPTMTLDQCPEHLTVLFVPGGGDGTVSAMTDPVILGFLRKQATTAAYITSVCTGSLVLGAAGLLEGYRATTHWSFRDVLPGVGAEPVAARVVEDRNRITAAGVSAGIDFALMLAAKLSNEAYAQSLQLNIEYDPQPPFHAGSPAGAGEGTTRAMAAMYAPLVAAARTAAAARA